MLTSLYTGLSGMTNHQEWLNVIGDNVANINTIGFKKSRVTFESALNLQERGTLGPRTCRHSRGGVDGKQIGLGVLDRSIDVIHTQGLGFEDSDKVTDVAISGDGYFVLKDAEGGLHYTRAGAFDFDAKRDLVNPANGMYVQGWMAAWDEVTKSFGIDLGSPISNINVKLGEILPAKPTSQIVVDGNLDGKTPTAIPSMIIEKNVALRSLSQVANNDAIPTVAAYLDPTAYRTEAAGGFPAALAAAVAPYGNFAMGTIDSDGTITINTSGASNTNYTSRAMSTYTTLNTLLEEINNLSGVNISYDQNSDMFTISAKANGAVITLGESSGNQTVGTNIGLFSAMNMPTGTHNTTISEKIKFTRLLDAQHPDREYYRWEAVSATTEEAIPMVESATTSMREIGENGTRRVSEASVGTLDLTQPFSRAGFDKRAGGAVIDTTTRVQIHTSSWITGGNTSTWTSAPLSDYVSVDQFLAVVNNQMSAPVTITYNADPNSPNYDTFTIINDVPGTAVIFEETAAAGGASGGTGFVTHAKFQTYTAALAANDLWNGSPATIANEAAVFNATTLPAKGILRLDPTSGKVIEHYIDTDENNNNVLDRTSEIPGTTAVITSASMPPRLFQGDLWPHTTAVQGTGKDYYRGTNGQIRESIWVNANIRGKGNVIVAGAEDAFTLYRNDVDNTRIAVTVDQVRVPYIRPGDPIPAAGGYFRFSNNTGADGLDELIYVRNGGPALANDSLVEVNYVRLGHSNLKPTDTFVPNGNEGAENITFSPNLAMTGVTNYSSYSPDDVRNNGFAELTDAGDPVTTFRLAKDKYLYSASQEIFDSQGEAKTLTFVFEKLDTKTWLWTARNPAEDANNPEGLLAGYGTLIFNYNGVYNRYLSETFQSPSDPATYDGDNGESQTGRTATIGYRGIYIDQPGLAYPADFGGSPPPEAGAAIIKLEPDFRKLTEQADLIRNASSVKVTQDGYKMGTLKSVDTIDGEGIIYGTYTNGLQIPKAQLALAQFDNPGGLAKESGTMFAPTVNSGQADIGNASELGSKILTKKLEKSNVDLAAQFIEMIIAERGFMANSRTISQADRILMDVMRLRM